MIMSALMQHRTLSTAVFAALVVAIVVGGCGIGNARVANYTSVQVTANFGSHVIGRAMQTRVAGSETSVALLEHHFEVTRASGGNVRTIGGRGGAAGDDEWFGYINGIKPPVGVKPTYVHQGDHVWWDLHDASAAKSIPAVVGAFPEPFTSGIGGKQFPTVLDCASNVQKACDAVGASLRKAGVKVSYQLLGGGSGSDSLAVVVSTWNDLKGVIAAELLAGGPAHSGVYARFVGSTGQAIELYNAAGEVKRTLHGSAGMVAATEQLSLSQPTWLVTGTDVAGVAAAAEAFTAAKLHNHFAVTVQDGSVIPVPVMSGS